MPKKSKEKIEELNTIQSLEKNTSNKENTKPNSKSKAKSKKIIIPEEKVSSTVKKTASKSTSKKRSSTKKSSKTSTPVSMEYYDLPFRYNQTVVKILAQTPNILFIYWDISDADRKSYEKQYGANFFENTRPVLVITNNTMNYTFEIQINDFANSWYLHINDANCDYKVELGRRFKTASTISISEESTPNLNTTTSYYQNEYVCISSSNEIESPNDHILFDKLGKSVFFKNVTTNFVEEKNVSSLSYMQNIGKIYNVYDLYQKIYKDELTNDEFELNLPSSNSSTFK